MKVLIYTHTFAPSVGGVETYVMLLAKGLITGPNAERPVAQLTVVTDTPGGAYDDDALPFRVVRRPSWLQLWHLMSQFDVIHLAGPVLAPLAMALLRQKSVVVEHHGYQTICPNGLLLDERTKNSCPGHFLARRYGQCLSCNAAAVGWQQSLVKLLLTFPRRWLTMAASAHVPITHHVAWRLNLLRSCVIYYGIPSLEVHDPATGSDPGAEQPPPAGQDLLTDLPKMTFAYVGRLVSEKGLPLLVDAASMLHRKGCEFRILFVGDGPERDRLADMAYALDMQTQVTFTGFLRGAELERTLATVDAVVMPSVWEETAGLAAMEQMMRGRVVIAADIGGLAEIVDDAGLKFPPGDAQALAECMQRILNEPRLAREVGARARQRAIKLFQEGRMIQEHLRLFRETLGQVAM